MDDHKARTQQLVREMMARTGKTATELARMVGVAPSTLTRFMNQPGSKYTLSARTLAKLVEATGVQVAWIAADAPPAPVPEAQPVPGIGERLRAMRISRGLSAEAFAARMSWPPAKLIRLEAEADAPTIADLVALRSAWDVSADFLLFEDYAAIPPRLMQMMVNQGAAPGASGPLRALRARMKTPAPEKQTLHEEIGQVVKNQ